MTHAHRNPTRPLCCPHCRATHLSLEQHHPGSSTTYLQREDLSLEARPPTPTSDAAHVRAHCQACGHRWKVRGVTSVLDFYQRGKL